MKSRKHSIRFLITKSRNRHCLKSMIDCSTFRSVSFFLNIQIMRLLWDKFSIFNLWLRRWKLLQRAYPFDSSLVCWHLAPPSCEGREFESHAALCWWMLSLLRLRSSCRWLWWAHRLIRPMTWNSNSAAVFWFPKSAAEWNTSTLRLPSVWNRCFGQEF